MILYLDTSALVKLLLPEPHTDVVNDWIRRATAAATSRVAFVEACAAMARRRREKRLTQADQDRARRELNNYWPRLVVVELDEFAAGELALKHALRGYDAVHLAAALRLRDSGTVPISVVFCSFDAQQADAARAEGLTVVP